jgi:hypothetical protein
MAKSIQNNNKFVMTIRSEHMVGMDIHYPICGLMVLAGAVVFLKGFDFLAAQSARRLREIAGARRAS